MKRRSDAGYTYITVLILLVAVALSAQVTWIPRSTERAREQEAELIFRGLAYRDAIESHFQWGGLGQYPATLRDLVDDPRSDGLRHIRRLYQSPVCDGTWRTIPAQTGGVMGVSPDCNTRPFRKSGFPSGMEAPENADSYGDWRFVFDLEQ